MRFALLLTLTFTIGYHAMAGEEIGGDMPARVPEVQATFQMNATVTTVILPGPLEYLRVQVGAGQSPIGIDTVDGAAAAGPWFPGGVALRQAGDYTPDNIRRTAALPGCPPAEFWPNGAEVRLTWIGTPVVASNVTVVGWNRLDDAIDEQP